MGVFYTIKTKYEKYLIIINVICGVVLFVNIGSLHKNKALHTSKNTGQSSD